MTGACIEIDLPDPGGAFLLGAGLGFGRGLLREARLCGLHVLHFGKHDVGGVLELVRRLFQSRGALRKLGLIVHNLN